MSSKDSYTIHSKHKELQSLRSRQHSKDIATKPLQFHILRAHGPGTFNFGPVVGTRGTVDCAVEAGDPGSLQSIFEIEGIARAKLDHDNRVFVELLNSDGSVAMHSDPVCPVYSPPVPSGYLLRFRLAWDSEGNLPESMRTNSPIAHLSVNGTWAGWIVASGISRVVFVEPYPKSLAEELHSDSILIDPPPGQEQSGRAVFIPYRGVAPRRYHDFFSMTQDRKDKTGSRIQKTKSELAAEPKFSDRIRRRSREPNNGDKVSGAEWSNVSELEALAPGRQDNEQATND